MANKYFADSSYLISLLLDTDSNYFKALDLTQATFGNLYISNYVLQEVITVVSKLRDSNFILNWLEKIFESKSFNIIYSSFSLDTKTIELIKTVKIKNISFIDYSNIIFMKEYEIDKLIAFDNHFKKLQKYHTFEIIS